MIRTTVFTFLAWLFSASCAWPGEATGVEAQCPPVTGVALQVLGSGGPIADDGRSSSSYIVWIDGKNRIMVDAGSGSFLRFGEAGARFEDLELIALSHYHTDHAAGLPALLKTGYFSTREIPLRISGPASGGPFPGLDGFLQGLLDPVHGSFRYLSGYLDGSGGLVKVEPAEIDHQSETPRVVFERPGLRVTALGIPHGIVPAVAYRVDAADRSIVFGADQNGGSVLFSEFARNADVLVAHMAIPEDAGHVARNLHATPSAIGKMATDAEVSQLLLSHFMARSLKALDTNIELVREHFTGDVIQADDMTCLVP